MHVIRWIGYALTVVVLAGNVVVWRNVVDKAASPVTSTTLLEDRIAWTR